MTGIIVDAYGERKAEEIMRDTWGHMDTLSNVDYPGVIVFAEGTYGNSGCMILKAEFGDVAGYGPWFYEGVHAWLWEQESEPGKIYRWTGVYRINEAGEHSFIGETQSEVIM